MSSALRHRGRYLWWYVLLAINRNTLLNSWWRLGLAGVWSAWRRLRRPALPLSCYCGRVARRAAAFMHQGCRMRFRPELWAGCLLPMVNSLWALYVIELARRGPPHAAAQVDRGVVDRVIVSNAISIPRSPPAVTDAQGIANNTTMMVLAYRAAAAAAAASAGLRFEQKPNERPAHRWGGGEHRRRSRRHSVAVELTGSGTGSIVDMTWADEVLGRTSLCGCHRGAPISSPVDVPLPLTTWRFKEAPTAWNVMRLTRRHLVQCMAA